MISEVNSIRSVIKKRGSFISMRSNNHKENISKKEVNKNSDSNFLLSRHIYSKEYPYDSQNDIYPCRGKTKFTFGHLTFNSTFDSGNLCTVKQISKINRRDHGDTASSW